MIKVKIGFLYSATYTSNQNSALHNLGSGSWLAIASGASALCRLSTARANGLWTRGCSQRTHHRPNQPHQAFTLVSFHQVSPLQPKYRTPDYCLLLIDDAKCVLVTRDCVSVCLCVTVCLSVAACTNYCMDPDVIWGNGRECPLVVQYWADLQSVHGFRCYDNIGRTQNVRECLYSLYAWFLVLWSLCIFVSAAVQWSRFEFVVKVWILSLDSETSWHE